MSGDRHLLVDGFNVLHAHAPWRALLKKDVGAARDALVEAVRVLHDLEGVRLTVVFDGQGETMTVEQPGSEPTLAVVFAPTGVSADAIVEQLVVASRNPDGVIVASGDRAIGQTAEASGATVWSVKQLLERVEAARRLQSRRITKQREIGEKFNPLL